MRKATAAVGILIAATTGMHFAARAAGMEDPYKVRAACEQRGEATSAAALKKCCATLLVVPPDRGRQRLEEQCMQGQDTKAAETPKKKSK